MDVISSAFGGGSSSDAGSRAAEDVAKAALSAGNVRDLFSSRAIEDIQKNFRETRENLRPFIGRGRRALAIADAAQTPLGLQRRIEQILDGNAFQSLVGERTRAIQGQLAAGGLTRSGSAINDVAEVPTDLALQIENMLFGRSRSLADVGLQGQMALTNARNFRTSRIHPTLTNRGVSRGNAVTEAAEARSSGLLADAQAEAAGGQNLLNTAATAAGIFFSDPRLKTNAEPVGTVCDMTLHQWDWIPEVAGTLVNEHMTTGFMADEVKGKYPHHVYEYAGFDVIDYESLLDELRDKCQH